MNEVHITDRSGLPKHFEYNGYSGDVAQCIEKFRADYPHYNPGTIFIIDCGENDNPEVWIPMAHNGMEA